MCIDYIDLNRVRADDSYMLINIGKPVGNEPGYQMFSFIDAYSMSN